MCTEIRAAGAEEQATERYRAKGWGWKGRRALGVAELVEGAAVGSDLDLPHEGAAHVAVLALVLEDLPREVSDAREREGESACVIERARKLV